MNTIIIYDQCGMEALQFFVIDGDYSKYDGIYVNKWVSDDEVIMQEYNEMINELQLILDRLQPLDKFPTENVTKDTKVIICGFIP